MPELIAPISSKNEAKRIVYGPVLVPYEPDTDGDVVTPEKIEEVAHKFMEDYQNIDYQHTLNNVGRVVESFITPVELKFHEGTQDEVTIPAGSWMMGVRVTDDASWEKVLKGELTGFSIMGIPKPVIKAAADSKTIQAAYKRTRLKDLKTDWVVNAVSLVDKPAVPKAKWVVIKSQNPDHQSEVTLNVDGQAQAATKKLPGSFESIRKTVEDAIHEKWPHLDTYVRDTFPDYVVIRNWSDGPDYYAVAYSYDPQTGKAEITGDLQPVVIQETIQPAAKSEGKDGILTKVMKALGVNKSWRMISDSNLKKLKEAKEAMDGGISALDELIKLGESERAQKSAEKGEGVDMTEEQVKALIKSELDPINEKLDKIVKSMEVGQEGQDNGQGVTVKNTDDNREDVTADAAQKSDKTSQLAEKVSQLEEVLKSHPMFRAASKSIFGQDGDDPEAQTAKKAAANTVRDAFGFKRNK